MLLPELVIAFGFCLALALSGCGRGAHEPRSPIAEGESERQQVVGLASALPASVEEAEERFIAAISGDVEALEAILSRDFLYSTAAGTTIDKQALMAHLRSGQTRVGKLRREDVRTTASEGVVVTTGSLVGDMSGSGRSMTRRSRYLHVWVPTPDGWRLLARQASYPTEERS